MMGLEPRDGYGLPLLIAVTLAGCGAPPPSTADAGGVTDDLASAADGASDDLSSSVPSDMTPAAPPLLSVNFDNQPLGDYLGAAINADWKDVAWSQVGTPARTQIVDGAEAYAGSKSLRVFYPQGGVGPGPGGAQWMVNLPGTYEELYVRYRVRLQPGFDFQEGGKLPGFCGGKCYTGGNNGLDGWSARIMWYVNGRVSQYVYSPGNVGYGDHFLWNLGGQKNLVPGQWHSLETRIVMNTAGQADGLLQGWFDGQLVLDQNNVVWRDPSAPAVGIDKFAFSTFFGGNLATNAPDSDMYIYFDDFVISAQRIGP